MEKKRFAKTQVFHVIILDRSGSMECIREAALQGVNETLAGIAQGQEKFGSMQDHYVTLVTFCGCGIKQVYNQTAVSDVSALQMKDFSPCCTTPLYDAMGQTLNSLANDVLGIDDYAVFVSIITDGMENTSKEYDATEIYQLVERLRGQGWSFTYMGTNQNVVEVASKMAIRNYRNFAYSPQGVHETMKKDATTRMNFLSRMFDWKSNPNRGVEENFSSTDRRKLYTEMADAAFDEEEQK